MNKYILILSIVLLSCNERKINKETFEEFEKTISDTLLIFDKSIIDTVPLEIQNENVIKEKVEDYFGVLEETKLLTLLLAEIQSLKKDISYSLPTSQMITNQDTTITIRRCGTYDTADETIPKGFSNRRMVIPKILNKLNVIPVNFFIIHHSNQNWKIDQADLLEQLTILNDPFAKLNIEFSLGDVSNYTNDKWYKGFSSDEEIDREFNEYFEDMVNNLPLNGNEMNVIINGCNLLGQASFPYEETLRTKYDHVIINGNSLNGKSTTMEGDTLIHEMGHYFGLYHTFHSTSGQKCALSPFNGCLEGDFVDDTPPQRFCHQYDCNIKDTCKNDTLKDDIKNYMGYNPDPCMSYFTNGQYIRMELFFYGDRYYLVPSI